MADTLNVIIGGMPGFTNGYPMGSYGLYTEVTNAKFDYASWFVPMRSVPLSAAWENEGANRVADPVTAGDGMIQLSGTWHRAYLPVLLHGLKAQRFEVTFSMLRSSSATGFARFVFNYRGPGDFDYIRLNHKTTGLAPYSFQVRNNTSHTARVEDRNSSNVPAAADGTNAVPPTNADAIWYRIVSDGLDVYVYAGTDEADLDTKQSANSWCMRTTASTDRFGFADGVGQLGFMGGSSTIYLDNITIKTDNDNDATFTNSSTFEKVEIEDDFTLVGGKLVDSPTYDEAGNMTFDGAQRYEYNASNQLIAVYNQGVTATPGIPATPGSLIATYRYGPTGRRIAKDIYTADGQDDAQHFYYHNWSIIETRNGSDQVTTQDIWDNFAPGSGHYIDSSAQTASNDNPGADDDAIAGGTQDLVDDRYHLLQDQQFSVRALIDATTGNILERYEYDTYGEQTVYTAAYTKKASSDYAQHIGFTGQTLDPESGLWYFRGRYYLAEWGRFISADPLGYPDGMNRYAGYFGMHGLTDPTGLWERLTEMGTFTGSFGPDSSGSGAVASSTLVLIFNPNKEAFQEAEADGSHCCDEVRFFQIYRMGGKNIHGLQRDRWTIDASNSDIEDGEPFYPHGGWGDPSEDSSEMDDSPYVNSSSGSYGFSLETCAVCSKGRNRGDVYGCVQASHAFRWYPAGTLFGWHRALNFRWEGFFWSESLTAEYEVPATPRANACI